jgi:hypothetical protein
LRLRWPLRRRSRVVLVGAAVAVLSGCLGDGYTLVGPSSLEFHPGVVYTTYLGTHDSCLWRGLTDTTSRATGGFGGIFLDGNPGRVFIQSEPWEKVVQSHGCGTWTPAKATSYNPARTQAGPGMYRVPQDLEPGTYSAGPAHSDRPCVVEVVKNWYGWLDKDLAVGYSSPITVTIKPPYVGLDSYDCTTWHKVG